MEQARCSDCKDKAGRLQKAIREGAADTVGQLLEAGIDPDRTTQDFWPVLYLPLHFAISSGRDKIVELLIQYGATIHGRHLTPRARYSPLHQAVDKNQITIVRLHLTSGAPVGEVDGEGKCALYRARRAENQEMVSLLRSFGADLTPQSWCIILVDAISTRSEAKIQEALARCPDLNFTDGGVWNPVREAVQWDHSELVSVLLSMGAPLNSSHGPLNSPLYMAGGCYSYHMVKYLIRSGADLKKCGPQLVEAAVEYNNFEVLKFLLRSGIDPNVVRGSTDENNNGVMGILGHEIVESKALRISVEQQNVLIAALLLKHGAHIKLQGQQPSRTLLDATVLDTAASNYDLDMVRLLLKNGAAGNCERSSASTVYSMALDNLDMELVRLLDLWGAAPSIKTIIGYGSWKDASSNNRSAKICVREAGRLQAVLQTSKQLSLVEERSRRSQHQANFLCSFCKDFQRRPPSEAFVPVIWKERDTSTSGDDLKCRLCNIIFDIAGNDTARALEVKIEMDSAHPRESKCARYLSVRRLPLSSDPALSIPNDKKSSDTNSAGCSIWRISHRWDALLSRIDALQDDTTGSDASFLLALYWLQDCLRRHRQCATVRRLASATPTRLVDLGPPDCDSAIPRLIDVNGRNLPYAALNHIWGDGESSTPGAPLEANQGKSVTQRVLKTTAEYLDPYKAGIPLASLTLTLRDAFTITRRLGLRYIWVDSLCIVQDDESDWRCESRRMQDIYQAAVLTISTSASRNHDQGILRPRSGIRHRPVRLDPIRISQRHEVLGNGATYVFSRHAKRTRPSAHVDSRGWILQEQMLSARTLHYHDDRIYWECLMCRASETSPDTESRDERDSRYDDIWDVHMFRKALAVDKDVSFEHSRDRMHEAWHHVVENYTKRALTFESDKLLACSGLIDRARSILDDVPVAGLWRRTLWRDLLWRVNLSVDQLPSRRGLTSKTIAPSWSWASNPCPVTYSFETPQWPIPARKDLTQVVEIISVKTWDGPSKGSTQGALRVRGPIFTLILNNNIIANGKNLEYSGETFHCWMDAQPTCGMVVWCLVVAKEIYVVSNSHWRVLCFEPLDEALGTFRRIGQCDTDRSDVRAKTTPEVKTITIL